MNDSSPVFADTGSAGPDADTQDSYDGDPSSDDANGSADSSSGDDVSEDVVVADVGPDAIVTSTGMSVLYAVQNSATMSPYIGCELSVLNSGTTSVNLSELEARYYYTDEDSDDVHLTPQMTINWSHVGTSGADADLTVTYAFVPVSPATTGADTYIAFSFSSSHSALAPGESAVFSWQMQGPDPATDIFDQNSDYSFDGAMTTLGSWGHVVLTQSGSVVWGAPP